MKKLYMLLAGIAFAGVMNAQTSWNISEMFGTIENETFFATTETHDGLTIYSNNNVAIDMNSKSITYKEVEYAYTHRLKFGGAGSFSSGVPTARVVTFEVDGPADITIMAQSSSGGTDRILNVAAGSNTNILGTVSAPGANVAFTTISYTEESPTTIYIWSPSSGVNLYHIIVEDPSAVSVVAPTFNANVSKVEYYNISGVNMGGDWNMLPAGIYIVKTTYDNGAVTTEKISKSRR
ncbi:hypothetical protein [Alkaliflexus imshenetskii]|uniref:hypothetical protein n=1 Tax=Alkaliflexus imshenetskii TaxID=286730 RepID=UPI00047DDD72|nr:hypothetical protein [Alkaliflexus imshenetskii]